MFYILLMIASLGAASAKDDVIKPLGKEAIQKFLSLVPQVLPKHIVGNNNAEGVAMVFVDHDAYQLYEANVDNSGGNEFILTFISSGATNGSGVHSIWRKDGEKLSNINFENLLPKKTHQFLASPFLVKRDSKIIMRFQDPSSKTKHAEYRLEGNKLAKL